MNRLTASSVAAMLALAGCGGNDSPRNVSLAPRTCAEPMFRALQPPGTVRVENGTRVGVEFRHGGGEYRVKSARVEVLAPGAKVSGAAIDARANVPLLAREEIDFAAADRDFSITFAGRDSAGNPLPPGLYPLVVRIATTPAGRCRGGDALREGVLATLDWRG